MTASEIIEKRFRAGIPRQLGDHYRYGDADLSLGEATLCRSVDRIIDRLVDMSGADELAIWSTLTQEVTALFKITLCLREQAQLKKYLHLLQRV